MKIRNNTPNPYLLLLLSIFLFVQSGYAIMADPAPFVVKQPDGTSLTVRLHGDEYYNFMTTIDGYTLIKNQTGGYVYAIKENDGLRQSDWLAHNIDLRGEREAAFLKSIEKYLTAQSSVDKSVMRAAADSRMRKPLLADYKGDKFKGLIILVQFNDRKFTVDNYTEVFTNMVNEPGFAEKGATGSVLDYFTDSSMGKFNPRFDVVGPVTVNYNQADAGQTTKVPQFVKDACYMVKDEVNFNDYDFDGNGEIDMVYVVFAGGGSHAGNPDSFVWPHMNPNKMSLGFDGLVMERYACSTELQSLEARNMMDGIGTICHEFSHVLGLPDLYDTDYDGSGGTAAHPDDWSVMASGSYLNNSHTPAAYSAYERYLSGWITPKELTGNGVYSLSPLNTSNECYRFKSPMSDEYFYFENRQKSGWDAYLPGHGMLIFRVDLTDPSAWSMNNVNDDPRHLYYELLCADNTTPARAGNAFPGTSHVTEISDETTPSLLSWGGSPSDKIITNITEKDGIISFNLTNNQVDEKIEDFDPIEKTAWAKETVVGTMGAWIFNNARTYSANELGLGKDGKVAAVKNGSIEMNFDITAKVQSVTLAVARPASTSSQKSLRIEYSDDGGATWRAYGDKIAVSSSALSAQVRRVALEGTLRFRVRGDLSLEGYIDNFTIRYELPTDIKELPTDSNTAIRLYKEGEALSLVSKQEIRQLRIYTLNGTLIYAAEPRSERAVVPCSGWAHGVYIVEASTADGIVKQKTIY
ncbi:MAG: M6 family metalloprotease domain-containing protein [Prevotellaceae bacterium]|jgi:M6 family metalloprotease-like protein|nr:M6 family metalloprotease domain-containing protein [Prevotellaceae bacterium]